MTRTRGEAAVSTSGRYSSNDPTNHEVALNPPDTVGLEGGITHQRLITRLVYPYQAGQYLSAGAEAGVEAPRSGGASAAVAAAATATSRPDASTPA
jgi:hypothetical protein